MWKGRGMIKGRGCRVDVKGRGCREDVEGKGDDKGKEV